MVSKFSLGLKNSFSPDGRTWLWLALSYFLLLNLQASGIISSPIRLQATGTDIYTECAKELIDGKQSTITCVLNLTAYNTCGSRGLDVFFYYQPAKGIAQEYCSTFIKSCHVPGSGRGNCSCNKFSETTTTFTMTFWVNKTAQENGAFYCDVFCDAKNLSKSNLYCDPLVFGCRENEFTCASNNQCIQTFRKCDQRRDCKDGSDELNCGGPVVGMSSDGSDFKSNIIVICLALLTTPFKRDFF